jgi:hypothetical protein
MSVLVWIEQNNGGPVGNSFEVLGKAKDVAGALGTQTVAVLIGGDAAHAEAGAHLWRRCRDDGDQPRCWQTYRLSALCHGAGRGSQSRRRYGRADGRHGARA